MQPEAQGGSQKHREAARSTGRHGREAWQKHREARQGGTARSTGRHSHDCRACKGQDAATSQSRSCGILVKWCTVCTPWLGAGGGGLAVQWLWWLCSGRGGKVCGLGGGCTGCAKGRKEMVPRLRSQVPYLAVV